MSKLVKDFKSFIGIDTVVAVLMFSSMWVLYYFTDFKFSREFSDSGAFEAYWNKIVIGFSIYLSIAGGFYFVNKLMYSTLETIPRLVIIALCVLVGGYFLYTIGSVPKNFLQSDVSLISIFSGVILFLMLVFGWREPEEVDFKRQEDNLKKEVVA